MVTKIGKLNVDVPEAINELQSMLKHFKLRKDIFKILFRGRGLEFEGFRSFTPDDDAADIDWKSSNKARKLLVKQYKEERDLRIMFLVDVGSNMVFGSTDKLKCEYATELIAALAYIIIKSNDRIGFVFFSDVVSNFVDTKSGEKHFYFFVDQLADGKNYGGNTNLNQALDFAMEYFDKSIHSVIIVSDLLSVTSETEKKLSILSSMFETVLIQIRDPLDVALPDMEGEIILEDPATKEQIIINPKVAKLDYRKYALEHEKTIQSMITKTRSDYLNLITNEDFAEPLTIFLKERRLKKAL